MAKLSYKARKALPKSSFVFPGKKKFPIPDKSHARNALARAGAKGPAVQAKVKAAVKRKFPAIAVGKKKKKGPLMVASKGPRPVATGRMKKLMGF